jgi:hypothetical protein
MLKDYIALQQQSSLDPQTLGVSLPKMTKGMLQTNSIQCTATQACEQITNLGPTQGWVMYRDKLLLTSSTPKRTDFIEGEWCNANQTIKVKHLQGNSYLVVTMSIGDEESTDKVYTQQVVYLRNDLQTPDTNAIAYRYWYQQAKEGDNAGRWRPLVQQFVGFTHANSSQFSDSKEVI